MKRYVTILFCLCSLFCIWAEDTDWSLYGTTPMPDSWKNFLSYRISNYTPGFDHDVSDAVISVYKRVNPDDPSDLQLRLDGMLNGGHSVILHVKDDDTFVSDYSDTGFKVIDENGAAESLGVTFYDEFKTNFRGSVILESGSINFSSTFLAICPEYGFENPWSVRLQMSEITPIMGKTHCLNVIPTTYSSPTTPLDIYWPESVAACRMKIEYGSYVSSSIADEFILDFSDAEYDAASGLKHKTYDLDLTNITRSNIVSVTIYPLGEAGKVIGYVTGKQFYVFRSDNHSWKSLGIGQMTDVMGFVGLTSEGYDALYDSETISFKEMPSVSNVEIQEAEDLPGYYRVVNPYGETHPLRQYLIPDTTETEYYMIIDATDPDNVVIPLSFVGFMNEGSPAYVESDQRILDDIGHATLSDNHITFPANTVMCSIQHVLGDFYHDLEITLPEAKVSISSIELNGNCDSEYYNLSGMRVNADSLTPGIYIVNGRKVIVR